MTQPDSSQWAARSSAKRTWTWTGCVVAAFVVAFLSTMYLWPDEPLTPGAEVYQRLQTPSPGPRAWFFGAYGFLSKGDLFERGKRIAVERQQAGVDPWKPELEIRRGAIDCAAAAAFCSDGRTAEPIRDLLAEHRNVMDNYVALYSATDFAFVLPPNLNLRLPPIDQILVAQRLLHVGLRNDPNIVQAIGRADQDLAHWRRVLAGTNTLLSKMAAARAVSRALVLRAALMDRLDAETKLQISEVKPLSAQEASISDALRFEVGIDYAVMMHPRLAIKRLTGEGPGIYALLPMKPNSTFNRHLRNYARSFSMAEMSREDLIAAMSSPPETLPAVTWWDYVINGGGMWLLRQADATQRYPEYMLVLRELEMQISRMRRQ